VLAKVESVEAECEAAKVEENDYTIFTCQDLEFELELVIQSIAKKIAFIDNQVRQALPCLVAVQRLTDDDLIDCVKKHDEPHARSTRTI